MKKVFAAVLAVALAVAIAAGGWWVSGRFAQRVAQAEEAAQGIATALATGQVPQGAGPGVAPPPADLESVLAGMGEAPHDVSVDGVELTDGGDAAAIGLRHSWRLDPGRAPWVYDTTARLRWEEQGWRLAWDPAVLAPGLREPESLQVARLQPQRGRILGADGTAFDPQQPLAQPVLGTVGPAGQEQTEASGGRVEVGEPVGLTGVQAAEDSTLAGGVGHVVQAQGAGDAVRELHRIEPTAGSDVRVGLDARVQRAAEQTLASVGPASAIVAVRPSDGNVLAAASGPGSQGFSTATLGRYAPGSTFKVVTAEALLAAGLTPDSTLQCSATTTAGGWPFRNYSEYPASALGSIPLRTAIAESCNTALINARDTATPQAVVAAATALGLLAEPQLGVPAYLGQFPTDVNETQHAAGLIGQGHVLASPLGMATVAASVGAAHTVTPRLVLPEPQEQGSGDSAEPTAGVTADPDTGTPGSDPAGPAGPAVPAGQQLQLLMRGVVDGGTASFLADVPGEPVLAKTGTAEYGTEDPPRTHAWMIGVQGDLAVSVFVEDGESGSGTAGPLLEGFLRAVAG